ncbi:MaoC/PaaZ C-terminal domain-containing protein [Solibacillus sp. CAU 1738]|uniref:MaoC/PaaZ C-terminal domain-containing protein n=1 Tax=Solibacillus sp. CAU 1738 TaxID=3140363 RepID=UPI0032600EE6
MLLRKDGKQGKRIADITVGEKLHVTEKIEDKDLLLYLGLTNDNNPLFIQHDYAAKTPFEQPIVPQIMLNGIITSTISKHVPGPGSYIKEQSIKFLQPVRHYETIDFVLQVDEVDVQNNEVSIAVTANNAQRELVIEGILKVSPPYL